ncbi:hypothetical protein BFG57_07445 [Bacillus solimangrovi]|uniref:Uncharacterized protein n=1 Tax=Bacillus solimangrovi TaxID=1305675 RepID=A0A1E5LK70_9BACI|nr:hypothetical protein BFG57_07445 [Bacillus solimangrovi]
MGNKAHDLHKCIEGLFLFFGSRKRSNKKETTCIEERILAYIENFQNKEENVLHCRKFLLE